MKSTLRALTVVLLSATAIAGLQGCKEDTVIKGNLNNIKTTAIDDATPILARTIIDDSIVTSLNITGLNIYHTLGKITDPICGTTNGAIYFQVLPEKTNYSFSANPFTIDSAFIILPFSGFMWGDTSATAAPQKITAYRVTDNMRVEENYYTFTQKNVERGYPITEATTMYPYQLKDSVSVLGVKRAPHLRMKLKMPFVNDLQTNAANSNFNTMFLDMVKGICIEGDSTEAAPNTLPYFKLNGEAEYMRASIQFFFHENGSTTTQTAFFNFTSDCAHYNRITRNYTGYPLAGYLGNTSLQAEVIMQNEPGAAIDLRFPDIKNLPQGLINKAELVITQVNLNGDNTSKFFLPERIFPVGIDPTGLSYTVLDRQPVTEVNPLIFMDGALKSVTLPTGITVNQYKLNLPREVQRAIVNKTEELHLRINGTQTYPGAYRLIAGGNTGSLYKVSLNVTYSQLK